MGQTHQLIRFGLGNQKKLVPPGYTCYAWAGGTFFPVVLLCQFLVLAGNRFWFYILLVIWFWQEIVFDVLYVLSVQYSCGAVSVFWLGQEIVLKMRTRFYKEILLGYFI